MNRTLTPDQRYRIDQLLAEAKGLDEQISSLADDMALDKADCIRCRRASRETFITDVKQLALIYGGIIPQAWEDALQAVLDITEKETTYGTN